MRLTLLACLVLAACDTTGTDTPDFGAGYVLDPASATLDGDTLRATVSYSGGCEVHTFRAASRRAGDGVEVWLVHGGVPDPCEAYPSQAVAVPSGVGDRSPVVLLTPAGASIRLR